MVDLSPHAQATLLALVAASTDAQASSQRPEDAWAEWRGIIEWCGDFGVPDTTDFEAGMQQLIEAGLAEQHEQHDGLYRPTRQGRQANQPAGTG